MILLFIRHIFLYYNYNVFLKRYEDSIIKYYDTKKSLEYDSIEMLNEIKNLNSNNFILGHLFNRFELIDYNTTIYFLHLKKCEFLISKSKEMTILNFLYLGTYFRLKYLEKNFIPSISFEELYKEIRLIFKFSVFKIITTNKIYFEYSKNFANNFKKTYEIKYDDVIPIFNKIISYLILEKKRKINLVTENDKRSLLGTELILDYFYSKLKVYSNESNDIIEFYYSNIIIIFDFLLKHIKDYRKSYIELMKGAFISLINNIQRAIFHFQKFDFDKKDLNTENFFNDFKYEIYKYLILINNKNCNVVKFTQINNTSNKLKLFFDHIKSFDKNFLKLIYGIILNATKLLNDKYTYLLNKYDYMGGSDKYNFIRSNKFKHMNEQDISNIKKSINLYAREIKKGFIETADIKDDSIIITDTFFYFLFYLLNDNLIVNTVDNNAIENFSLFLNDIFN